MFVFELKLFLILYILILPVSPTFFLQVAHLFFLLVLGSGLASAGTSSEVADTSHLLLASVVDSLF